MIWDTQSPIVNWAVASSISPTGHPDIGVALIGGAIYRADRVSYPLPVGGDLGIAHLVEAVHVVDLQRAPRGLRKKEGCREQHGGKADDLRAGHGNSESIRNFWQSRSVALPRRAPDRPAQ